MNVNYIQIHDCPSKGETCIWHKETIKGYYLSYGDGVMTQLNCLKCGTIRYLEFNGVQIQDEHGNFNPHVGEELTKLKEDK